MTGLAPEGMWIGRSVSLCSTLPRQSPLPREECASRPVLRTAVGLCVHGTGTQGRAGHRSGLGACCVMLNADVTSQHCEGQ